MPWGIAAAAVIGGVASYAGASAQAGASQNATNAQEQMFNEQLQNEAPYRNAGGNAISELDYLEGIGPMNAESNAGGAYGSLNQPFTTANWKSLSPQYNMQLQQGAQGTLNGASSSQGALSGAALSGLQANNQSIANSSFNNAFNMYQTQNQNVYSRLAGIANIGEAASSNQATGGSNYAQGIGQSITNTGTAIGGGIAGAGNSVSNAALLGALYQGSFSGGNAGSTGGAGGGGDNPFQAYCDYGLKKNIVPYHFHQMTGLMEYAFNWNVEEDDAPKSYGPIAQEVQKLYPQAVTKGPEGFLMVDYSKLPGWDEIEAIGKADA